MSRDTALPYWPKQGVASRVPEVWRLPLICLVVAAMGLMGAFWRDWFAMADQWWNSSTYNHIIFVPAIVAWLVMLRAPELARLSPRAWWPGLLFIAGACFLWLLGAVSGLNLARQLGAVAMLQGAVLALLGPRVAAALLFPLCYMLFLVPFGDELVPPLQLVTAKLTIALTHWSGIPAVVDGVFIDTPVGLFEVAEACSGVKFLVAMVALGVLISHVCFKGWGRRLAFMAICIVVPILANGVRAWGTIYIAQFRGIEFAAGFDHIIYGWVFFAIILAVILAIAWRFFDRASDSRFINADAIERSAWLARLPDGRIGGVAAMGEIGAMALTVLLWAGLAGRLSAEMPRQIALPQVQGWQLLQFEPQIWWEPRAEGANHRLLASYVDDRGHKVDVFFALYASQEDGKEAGGFGQGALIPDTPWRWLEPGPAVPDAKSERLLANGQVKRLAATYYRTGGLLTGSNGRLKLATMRQRLLLDDEPTMVLILSAEDRAGHPPPEESISALRKAAGPIDAWMDRIAKLR
ncbi:exosortase A [Tsuneonella sp. CC-YZS046]|uniref:exosortase A n=1 Tax=Tsuneonella sp. CC-YZS046 TaxID=3042152 RepID=UPI002D77A42A|nr:exosortase A [Tsuneonella sp. CC-YZS046]WRO67855.1 exosortase A [Tsuneonella sp. CC-YZS046]